MADFTDALSEEHVAFIARRSSANVIPMSRALAIRQGAEQRQLQPSA